MKKVIRLTESDLTKLVKRVLSEDLEMMDVSSDSHYYKSKRREVTIPFDELSLLGNLAHKFCKEDDKSGLPDCSKVKELYRRYNLYI